MKSARVLIMVGLVAVPLVLFAQTEQVNALNKARGIWHACILKEASSLDDGVSPASDIATGVQMSCIPEHDAMLDQMTIGPEIRYQFSQQRVDLTKQVAIKFVLQLRAEKREPREQHNAEALK